jgi:hypothetical protein
MTSGNFETLLLPDHIFSPQGMVYTRALYAECLCRHADVSCLRCQQRDHTNIRWTPVFARGGITEISERYGAGGCPLLDGLNKVSSVRLSTIFRIDNFFYF